MKCKPGDLVIVVKSHRGNLGRIGKVLHWQPAGVKRPGRKVNKRAGWMVEGRFTLGPKQGNRTVDSFVFADDQLCPLRGDGKSDDVPTTIDKPIGEPA